MEKGIKAYHVPDIVEKGVVAVGMAGMGVIGVVTLIGLGGCVLFLIMYIGFLIFGV